MSGVTVKLSDNSKDSPLYKERALQGRTLNAIWMEPMERTAPNSMTCLLWGLLLKPSPTLPFLPVSTNSYPDHFVLQKERIFVRICDLMILKHLTVDLTVLHNIFTNQADWGGALSYPAWVKAAIFCKDNKEKNMLYTAYINYIFSLPVMFSAGLCIITAKCNEIGKEKRMDFWEIFQFLKCNVN